MAVIYFLSILLPGIYCLSHGCKGPGELDAFMPAFMFALPGSIATAFSLRNAMQQIKRNRSWAWILWPVVIIFGIVLAGTIAVFAIIIFETAVHR
jgi:hypothetical protein